MSNERVNMTWYDLDASEVFHGQFFDVTSKFMHTGFGERAIEHQKRSTDLEILTRIDEFAHGVPYVTIAEPWEGFPHTIINEAGTRYVRKVRVFMVIPCQGFRVLDTTTTTGWRGFKPREGWFRLASTSGARAYGMLEPDGMLALDLQ